MHHRPELLYPQPPVALQPERLRVYLNVLHERVGLDGDVVEVGCWLGGTAAIASRFLRRSGFKGKYVCIDTFDGFVAEQFEYDRVNFGVPESDRDIFDGNRESVLTRLLPLWGASEVELVRADIATIEPSRIPTRISACLMDVDLAIPIAEGLKRVWPNLTPGGIIVVDDCPPETSWAGAKVGYQRFVQSVGLAERYEAGFGIIEKA